MENALGLPEFTLGKKPYEEPTGRAIYYDAVKDDRPIECPSCLLHGPFYSHGKGEPRLVTDIPAHGKFVFINVTVRRWKCRNTECGYVFSDYFDSIDGKEQMTRRLRYLIRERAPLEPFSKLGREYNVSEGTVRGIFRELVEECEQDLRYKAPRVLRIDEAHLDDKLRTVITDTQNNRLLDIVPHRDSPKLVKFLKEMEGANRVKVVTMDMYEGFRAIVKKALPKAHIVVDHYHVIQLTNRKLDMVRIELKRNLISLEKRLVEKSRTITLTESELGALQFATESLARFKGTAKLFTKNREDMKQYEIDKIMLIFQHHPELRTAFYLKEFLRRIYRCKSRKEAGDLYLIWKKNIPDYMEPFKTLAETIDSWAREIFNFFYFRFSNGFAENRNGWIKRIQQDGRALSFEQMRYKVLFASRATKLPKFNKRKAEWFESASFGNMMSSYGATIEELVEGFYVDMDEYVSLRHNTHKVHLFRRRNRT